MTPRLFHLEAARAFALARAERRTILGLVERKQLPETCATSALAAVHGLALVAHGLPTPIALRLEVDDRGEVVLCPIWGAP